MSTKFEFLGHFLSCCFLLFSLNIIQFPWRCFDYSGINNHADDWVYCTDNILSESPSQQKGICSKEKLLPIIVAVIIVVVSVINILNFYLYKEN
jgi:hypothetical protein